jgi:hypothetical protein
VDIVVTNPDGRTALLTARYTYFRSEYDPGCCPWDY